MQKLFCVILLSICSLHASPFVSNWTCKVVDGIRVEYKTTHVLCEKMAYEKGGVRISFPENYFSKPPLIYVALEAKKLVFSPHVILSSIVVDNTVYGAIIKVNKQIPGIFTTSIVEADNDDVAVSVFAVEDESGE